MELLLTFQTNSEEETSALGEKIGSILKPGDIVTLTGDLGAGKTHFTAGAAKALGINEYITSPTFTIVNEYTDGRVPMYHFDLYRLSCMDDLYDIGWDDYVSQDAIIIIEWADIVKNEFDYPYIEIIISKLTDESETKREITIKSRGGNNENFSNGHIVG